MENPKKKYVKRLLSTLQTTANKTWFDFLNNREYNCNERVASKRKSSLPATRFHFAKINIAMKKCVACQRKSSLYDKVRTFFVPKREELKQNGRKKQDERYAGE